MSTGPKAAGIERIERIGRAVTKHERCSKRAGAERERYRKLLQHCWAMLTMIDGNGDEVDARFRGNSL
jgi:hypothetical protein